MGEVEKTLERLNEVLKNAGFAEAYMNPIGHDGESWLSTCNLPIRFDNDGNYIEPNEGKYR